MSVQDDIQFYYRRAAEARARGKEALAQTMENYARNLEAGIYDDDGRGFDMGASNQRWAQKEAEEAARRKAAEEQLYASRPRRNSGGSGRRQSTPSYSNIQNGDYYDRPKYSNGSTGDFRRMDEPAGYAYVPPADISSGDYYDRPKYNGGSTGDFRRMDEAGYADTPPANISDGDYYDRPRTGAGYTEPPDDYPVVRDGGYGVWPWAAKYGKHR